jgi:hypothetical protein
MFDLKASAAAEVTAGVFAFLRVAYVVPRFLMSALKPFGGRQSSIALSPKRAPISDIDHGWRLSQRGS